MRLGWLVVTVVTIDLRVCGVCARAHARTYFINFPVDLEIHRCYIEWGFYYVGSLTDGVR